MTEKAKDIERAMTGMGDKAQAAHLMRFFKCGPGQYGFGDLFLGIRVPDTRSFVKAYRSDITLEDITGLVKSRWHEVRLAGFLFLIELYNKASRSRDDRMIEKTVETYIEFISYGNNWDLVDLIAPKILGDYLVTRPEKRFILSDLSDRMDSLWHQRVAIVATWSLIRNGIYEETLELAKKYLSHPHDLIHKASGWMLRETGKRGGEVELKKFLDRYAAIMPRTMLRYSIERFPESERQYYMKISK